VRHCAIAPLPHHRYVWVDQAFTHQEPHGFTPAVWFGLVSLPGRMWGCNVLLESGAIYRNIPPHGLLLTAPGSDPEPWTPHDAQEWDCYGTDFALTTYDYLDGLQVKVRANGREHLGRYLFTALPIGDGFSAVPDQSKEFSFCALDNGRLTIQPTNHVLFDEPSFTVSDGWPTGLKRQTEIWRVE